MGGGEGYHGGMRVRIPSSVPEEGHDTWIKAYVAGYWSLRHADSVSRVWAEDTEAPSAYYAGQKQAYLDMSRSRGR
jgi:hypothetical protein